MKKIFILLVIACFFMPLSFAGTTNPAPPPDQKEEGMAIGNNLELVKKTRHEENQDMKYVVDLSYPEITGDTITPAAEKFNQAVNTIVNTEVEQFKKYVKADAPHMKMLPESVQHNTLNIEFNSHVIKANKKTLISIRFNTEGYQAGRAHPYHMHSVLNYDLDNAKVLTLNDLFKPQSNYLKIFATESRQQLKTKIKDDTGMLAKEIAEGTAPQPKNYKNWNLQANGILITFEEYQVAPYVYGPQEVVISYDALKKFIAVKGPVVDCVKVGFCTQE